MNKNRMFSIDEMSNIYDKGAISIIDIILKTKDEESFEHIVCELKALRKHLEKDRSLI